MLPDTFSFPFFNELDIKSIEDYYDIDIEFHGKKVSIDLNFEVDSVKMEDLNVTKNILENIESFYQTAHAAILAEVGQEGSVDYYINEVSNEMDEECLEEILENADKTLDIKEQILSKIYLKRVGIYSQELNKVILDFTISQDYWDDLIVVWMFSNGQIDAIGIES